MRRAQSLVAALVCVASVCTILLCSRSAFALDPSLGVSQYAHNLWKYRDGFAKQFIESIAQTPDGYLWLGTGVGLYRFDGVRAVQWQSNHHQQLPSTTIAGLLVSRDGTLWIGTKGGLASWKGGTLTQFPQLAGLIVYTITEAHDGTVWAGGFAYSPPGKLCAIRTGSVHCYGADGIFGNGVLSLHEDGEGTLWVGVLNGFFRWKSEPQRFYHLADEPYGIQSFAEDRDGTLLVPATGKLLRLADGKLQETRRYPGAARQAHSLRILRDRGGGLWIGTLNHGLVHLHNGNTDTFTHTDGLSGDRVTSIFEDREGSIWVATTEGLDRFRAYSVATFSEGGGLSGDPNASVIAAIDGSIWFNANGRLSRWNEGLVTVHQGPGAQSESIAEASSSQTRDIAMPGLPKHDVASLYRDAEGHIWVAGNGGVGYVQDGKFVRVDGLPGGIVYAMAGDVRGNLWISMLDRGLFHLRNGRLLQRISWGALGRHDLATAVAVDPSGDGIWIGFSQGGLAFLPEGGTQLSFTTAPAFDGRRVSDIHFDHNGALWVASEGGLSRLKNGRVFTLSTKNGLPCDSIYWIQQEEGHAFWLYGSCGLIRLELSDLSRAAANGGENPQSVRAALFDAADGVDLLEPPGSGPGSHSARAPDGKIWFPTPGGLSVIDPSHLPYNKLPPPVHIEEITADGKTYDAFQGLRLPSRLRDLTIDYTALSLVVPEKVHFRFELQGQDRDWREAINDREVQYSNLHSGNYRFRVIASNNSGVWNETGASLDFSIAPAYYQTSWFRALCAALFLAFLWAIYQFRVRQLRQQFNVGLEAGVNERTRIARELHDTLLQSFHGLLFQFQAVRNMLPQRTDEAMKTLDGAITATEQAIAEGRDAIHDLRPKLFGEGDLAQMLTAAGQELATLQDGNSESTYRVIVEGAPRMLSPRLEDEVYRIGREIIRNAFRHADARQIEVEIRYDNQRLRLRIRDDGRGIDAKVLDEKERMGHWGLAGIRERAQRIGSRLDIWSEAGAGTEVQLTVPAAIAYQNSSDSARFGIFRQSRKS